MKNCSFATIKRQQEVEGTTPITICDVPCPVPTHETAFVLGTCQLQEGPCNTVAGEYDNNFSKGLQWFTQLTVRWIKGNIQKFQRLLTAESELTLIPGAPPSQIALVQLTEYAESMDSSRGPFPGTDKRDTLQSCHICSLASKLRNTVMEKAKWKPLELLSQCQIGRYFGGPH